MKVSDRDRNIKVKMLVVLKLYFCESINHSSFRSVGSVFHVRGAAIQKALSVIRRHARGMTRLPHDEAEACNAGHTVQHCCADNTLPTKLIICFLPGTVSSKPELLDVILDSSVLSVCFMY